jgi:20S proteasome alpha/beta subunit
MKSNSTPKAGNDTKERIYIPTGGRENQAMSHRNKRMNRSQLLYRHPTSWQSLLVFLLLLLLSLMCTLLSAEAASFSIHERHAFSLSTFDKSGKLEQVERAMVAASKGVPLILVTTTHGTPSLLLAAPQLVPNTAFYIDDGTPRFARIAPHIVMGYSGIAADGRVLVQAAQRLAVEHSYTFDEDIPVALVLEEISLLVQEFTMKPGVRPFGCTLVVGVAVENEQGDSSIQLYRIDASGTVTQLYSKNDGTNVIMINGGPLEKDGIFQRELQELSNDTATRMEDRRKALHRILKDALAQAQIKSLSKAGEARDTSDVSGTSNEKKRSREQKESTSDGEEKTESEWVGEDSLSSSIITSSPAAMMSMRIITASFEPKKEKFIVDRWNVH